jgi:selenide,water dikinase
VVTADFITPPVDDPFLFGQIGAANSLSDIYAMGGRPLTCLNLIGFPANDLGPEILHGIVQGALSKISEAGAVLAGGHTTDDDEPKFGLAVTGIVHPERIWRNSGARVGDVLIMTKPLGSGVLFNANLKGMVSATALAACVETITTLNKDAAETLARFDVHAATDITGFGFAGHALEMARGSAVSLNINTEKIPLMAEALAMYEKGVSTGVNGENRALTADYTRYDLALEAWHREIFVDPQTSGGLLVSIPEAQGDRAVEALRSAGVTAAVQVGTVSRATDKAHLIFT